MSSDFFNQCKFAERLDEAVGPDRGNQKKIAALSGVSESSISQYISMTSGPSVGAVVALAGALNIQLDWLLAGRGARERDAGAQRAEMLFSALTPERRKIAMEVLESLANAKKNEHD